jgi:hypothetical protein
MVVWPNEIDTCEQTKKSTPVSWLLPAR